MTNEKNKVMSMLKSTQKELEDLGAILVLGNIEQWEPMDIYKKRQNEL